MTFFCQTTTTNKPFYTRKTHQNKLIQYSTITVLDVLLHALLTVIIPPLLHLMT